MTNYFTEQENKFSSKGIQLRFEKLNEALKNEQAKPKQKQDQSIINGLKADIKNMKKANKNLK